MFVLYTAQGTRVIFKNTSLKDKRKAKQYKYVH